MKARLPRFLLVAALLACAASRAGAADLFTYSFNSGMNCYGAWTIPDSSTATMKYTATNGEDADYDLAATHPNYTVLNPVGISSVTVDNVTGLMWVYNMNDAGMGGTYTWMNALNACETLNYANYSDWRLPNVRELMSIVEYGALSEPRINKAYFAGTVADVYWTSTTYPTTPTGAWIVSFTDGTVNYYGKGTSQLLRCVRGRY